MKVIADIVKVIDEEIEGAKNYAESYIEHKVGGDTEWAAKYKEMASDELKHAMYLHELAVTKIKSFESMYPVPTEMQERWDKSHKQYVEKTAWIKQMMSM